VLKLVNIGVANRPPSLRFGATAFLALLESLFVEGTACRAEAFVRRTKSEGWWWGTYHIKQATD